MLYGGAVGGAKTASLLLAALQFVDIPGYAALLLRRTYPELTKARSLIPLAHEWLANTDAEWNEQKKTYTFPSGATIEFGHMEHEKDKYNFDTASYQYIGFDELASFTQTQYLHVEATRLRKPSGMPVPLRIRSGSNPRGAGSMWIKQRFIVEGKAKGRIFVPAKLRDNAQFIDVESYLPGLMGLDPYTRAQLLDGDWDAKPPGGLFRREWFKIVKEYPRSFRTVRYWDMAATPPEEGKDPDWTVGTKMTEYEKKFYIIDIKRTRTTPHGVEQLITQTAALDDLECEQHWEEEGGSSGKIVSDHYMHLLNKYIAMPHRNTGPESAKLLRIGRLSAQAQAGNVFLVEGPWINDFLDEVETLPDAIHDDQADSACGAYSVLVDDAIDLSGLYAGGQRLNYEAQISS